MNLNKKRLVIVLIMSLVVVGVYASIHILGKQKDLPILEQNEISSLPKDFTTLSAQDKQSPVDKMIEIDLEKSQTNSGMYTFKGDKIFPFVIDIPAKRLKINRSKVINEYDRDSLSIVSNMGSEELPELVIVDISKQKMDIHDPEKYFKETIDYMQSNGNHAVILNKGVRGDKSAYIKSSIKDGGLTLYFYSIAFPGYMISLSYSDILQRNNQAVFDKVFDSFRRGSF